jgi:hypothetical protein
MEIKKTKVHVNRPLLEGVSIFDLIIPWKAKPVPEKSGKKGANDSTH